MALLEQFEDNLNLNISNSILVNNFIKTATSVRAEISDKYHDGEFMDPADFDPQAPVVKHW